MERRLTAFIGFNFALTDIFLYSDLTARIIASILAIGYLYLYFKKDKK